MAEARLGKGKGAAGARGKGAGAAGAADGEQMVGPGQELIDNLRGEDKAGIRKVLAGTYAMVSKTPDDGSGMVEGTPFTMAGAKKLADKLNARAGNEGEKGAKAASVLLQMLGAKEGDDEVVHGLSVMKLSHLAKLADGIRGARGGARGGAGAGAGKK